jgi:hypothetical protein
MFGGRMLGKATAKTSDVRIQISEFRKALRDEPSGFPGSFLNSDI